MGAFTRNMSSSLIGLLKSSTFFNSALLPDIKNGEVFPAIRNESMDFYYKGGKLFGFDKDGFYTHKKYAGVMDSAAKDYVYESDILAYHKTANLDSLYPMIKEYCLMYSGLEAAGVSKLYHKFSFIDPRNKIAVLDIEIAFEEMVEPKAEDLRENKSERENFSDTGIQKGTDRIDILLIDRSKDESGKLRFIEAKHYTNSELWSKSGSPRVMKQIARYNKQIKKNYTDILKQYENYCDIMNQIYSLRLPNISEISYETKLLVFGFDSSQRSNPKLSALKKAVGKDLIYTIGSPKSMNTNSIKALFYKRRLQDRTRRRR